MKSFKEYLIEGKFVTRAEVIKNLKDTEALGYIQTNQPNWTNKEITDKLALKLANEGIIAYNTKDDIWIWGKWIDLKTGDYNKEFYKVWGEMKWEILP